MDSRKKLATIAVVLLNLMILLYINFTSQMSLVSHLVLIPCLILELLAFGGFALERSSVRKNHTVSEIRCKPHRTVMISKIKPAA